MEEGGIWTYFACRRGRCCDGGCTSSFKTSILRLCRITSSFV